MMRTMAGRFFLAAAALAALAGCGAGREESAALAVFSGAGVSAGKAAAGLGDYRIAYYEAVNASLESEEGGIEESAEPFAVVDYGPAGELPAEIRKPAIYVVFSQPVVPLARLGAPIRDGSEFFAVDPPLPGVFRWYGSRLLSFEPDAESLPQRRYTVTVSDRIRSLGGKALPGAFSFSFETERLSALSWRLGPQDRYVDVSDASPDDARTITVVFSHPVNLAEIARWLEVRAGGRSWEFGVSRPEKAETRWVRGRRTEWDVEQTAALTLKEPLPPDTAAEFVVLAGARSEAGWLGTKEERRFPFRTLRPFRFRDYSVRSQASPRTMQSDSIPLVLSFSHAVDPQGAEKHFLVDGLPAPGPENLRVYGSQVVLTGLPLAYRREYTVRVSAELRDLWGRRLGAGEVLRLRTGDAGSYWYSPNAGPRMLEAAFPPKIVWETQNPLFVRRLVAPARGPYGIGAGSLDPVDPALLPRNSKRYFMEDLLPLLGSSGRGSVAFRWDYATERNGSRTEGNSWLTVQVTDIGITVRYAYNRVLVWATRLSTGEPVAGARVELLNGEIPAARGATGPDGLARIDFPPARFASLFFEPKVWSWTRPPEFSGLRVRVVEGGGAAAGGDEAEFIPNDSHNLWRFSVHGRESPFTVEREKAVVFLYTDRGIYRPGETVTFRGIDRRLSLGRYSPWTGDYAVKVMHQDGRRTVAELSGSATATGGSFGSFALPGNLDPGTYWIRYVRGDAPPGGPAFQGGVSFRVANFERLRMESSLSFPDVTVFQGDSLRGSLSASYLAGGALASAPYTWYWTREAAFFHPGERWKNWRFGQETGDSRSFLSQGSGNLDPQGKASIGMVPQGDGVEGASYRYRLEASVQDAARQEISSRASVVVHPASFYIGARLDAGTLRAPGPEAGSPPAYFLPSGSPATASWVLVGPDGEGVRGDGASGELSAQFLRHEWKQSRQAGVGGRVNLIWERVETVVEERTVPLAPAGRRDGSPVLSGVLHFTPDGAGQWEIRLRGRDAKDRPALTRLSFYVSGSGWVRWGSQDGDAITLTPDRSVYNPGETAKLLVQSPLPRGKYLLTVEREGILEERIIELDGSARTIDIPVDASYIPVVYVALSSYTVRSGPPGNSYYEPDLDKPRGLFGLASLSVDAAAQGYQIAIEPRRGVYGPGEEAEVLLRVSRGGRPAPGVELSFMAVDRGVVDIIDYHVPDPLAWFFNPSRFPLAVRGADSRSLLIDPVTYALSDLQGGDSGDDSKTEERRDWRPTAVFEPWLVSGPDGTVRVRFRLPDSLTAYRCTALAAGTDAFGLAEGELRVSAPLTAVVAAPRKLRWRDTGQVSLVLGNLEKEAVEARVSLAIENASEGGVASFGGDAILAVDGEAELTVPIGPGMTAEARFPVAALGTGTARLVFTLRSPRVNERIVRELRVDRPQVYETVAVMGSLGNDRGFIEEGLALPSPSGGGDDSGGGDLSLSVSASRIALLKDAAGYLLDYPYGCLEQRTARLLPLIAFGDHLGAFDLESRVADPRRTAEEELALLPKNRLADGAWPYWPGDRHASYFVTARVGHIIALARARGYALPDGLEVPRLVSWLAGSEQARNVRRADPFLWGYGLWVRAMLGSAVVGELKTFLEQGDRIGVAGMCFAGLAALEQGDASLATSIRDRVRRFIRPGTRSLDITDTAEAAGGFAAYWGFDTDAYALALMLYQALSPGDDMTTRLANALLDRRRGTGHWGSTSATFWAILAFGRIADAEAGESAPQSVRVRLGGVELLSAAFRSYGGTPASARFPVSGPPLAGLPRNALLPLRFERDGNGGRIYYNAALRYGIPAELAVMRDEGLGLFTETLDGEGNRVTGPLAAGKVYTRRVLVSSPRTRTWVALRVPVPSGAEIIDASFVTSPTPPPEEAPEEDPWRIREQPPRQFILDDEVRFHWDYFAQGRKEASFRFRAVMPGVYPTPPAQAECMYEAEVFGRSAGELVIIR